jgi:hypothetical protein
VFPAWQALPRPADGGGEVDAASDEGDREDAAAEALADMGL